jgi:D-alanyl-D-alanine carboxypeptidase (penicillin-binding protein 5/6)
MIQAARLPATLNWRRAAILGALIALAVVLGGPHPARASGPPHLSVRSAILVEQSTGRRLSGVDPYHEMPIASTTKLMTALVTLEHVRLNRTFVNPSYTLSPADSQIGLVPGERMSVHDLLLALLLPSADDAAEDLAYNVGHHSVSRFIAMMNLRARQLGLTHTHYSTPIGLDTPGNYSAAADLVKLASYELRTEPFFAKAVGTARAVLRTGNHVRVVANRNDLVGRVPWIHGVKTGHTLGAGYVLVGSGARNGMTLLSAVLGTTSEAARDANTLALLGYGFATFRLVKPVRQGQVLARPTVRDRPGMHAAVTAARSFETVVRRGTRLTVRVQVPSQLAGPLAARAAVGTAVVLEGGRPVARIPLQLVQAVPAVSSLTHAARFITRPSTLVSIAALLAVAVAVAVRRRERVQAPG